MLFSLVISHHLVTEESDSDSDEELEGGVRHDLMMADEKVQRKFYIHSTKKMLTCENYKPFTMRPNRFYLYMIE